MAKRFGVDWAEVARTDLDELLDFIEQDEPGAALLVLDRLEQAAKRLESMPLEKGPGGVVALASASQDVSGLSQVRFRAE